MPIGNTPSGSSTFDRVQTQTGIKLVHRFINSINRKLGQRFINRESGELGQRLSELNICSNVNYCCLFVQLTVA